MLRTTSRGEVVRAADQCEARLVAHDMDSSYGEPEPDGGHGGPDQEKRLEFEGGDVGDEAVGFA